MVAGGCYHVINRGNNRSDVFLSPSDYLAFVALIAQAQRRIRLSILAACLMPNHFHLVILQSAANDASRWMQWLLTTFSHRHHRRHGTCGRLWQGRFKAFPIEQDAHLLTVIRYVERNALRARLVRHAEDWPWGSLAWRQLDSHQILTPPPVRMPNDWLAWVNAPQTAAELSALRECVNRQRPFGSETWTLDSAGDLGLQSSLRKSGRPRKHADQATRLSHRC
jgi:putative transposase